MKKEIKIGLFGFGSVGRGLYDVLGAVEGKDITIRRICVRDLSKDRGVSAEFTDQPDRIFEDPEINMIVELIDDAEAAYRIVRRALEAHLPVVSGNKKMLAYHLPELIELGKQTATPFLYDASACGSIPVIRNLEEYYDNDLLVSVKGILNGSSNFVLSKIFNENMTYDKALRLAQELGFAESDPSLDFDGWDSLFKLVILTIHAFGIYVAPEKIFRYGISTMNEADIRFASEKQRRIKLVGHVEKKNDGGVYLWVVPQLISRDKYIYSVEDEFNGVVIKGRYYYKQFMFGRGAGGHPTGAAVLSDITACKYDYRYEYKRMNSGLDIRHTDDVCHRIYFRYRTEEDRNLLKFQLIREQYTSGEWNYVVGDVCLSDLVAVKDSLAGRDIFIAAYPWN
ncbi:MAG: homoserine dehydrogenase [Tidjanibacter sp.]|nr:homoserine dehydrogenase [Tidjanibacter sp.]MBQ3070077.1 homoserine dehydrogenase [Tidjanibacter sp.]MBR1957773.1 homoserine dehydrogenase [Tidjanibacter sp.]MBR3931449.1 homoserine dehydrogenase [Tidjanibacter sp.]